MDTIGYLQELGDAVGENTLSVLCRAVIFLCSLVSLPTDSGLPEKISSSLPVLTHV